jgi:pyruvate,orthophosphate dikinase
MSTKYVYFFGGNTADGDASQKNLLGGKGANLAEMCRVGLPVPAGFTLTTEVCNYFYDHGKQYPPELKAQVADAMKKTEEVMGAKFGDAKNPLLVSCRSGARVSMPGMMDTVLNLGLNRETAVAIAEATADRRFMADILVRFHRMYSEIVLGASGDAIAEAARARRACRPARGRGAVRRALGRLPARGRGRGR